MNLKQLTVWGWVKLIVGLVSAGVAKWLELGGHIPENISTAIAAVTAIVTSMDKSAGLKAAATDTSAQVLVDKAVALNVATGGPGRS